MERECLESKSSFVYKFDGKSEISASTLSATLNSLVDLINVATLAEDSDAYARLNIKAIEKGSFLLYLKAVVMAAPNLLTPENVEYACNVVQIVFAFFEIKRHIRGGAFKVEKQEKEIKVVNEGGEARYFPAKSVAFFENPHIDNFVMNCITSASLDGIHGINLNSDVGNIDIRSEDYEGMTVPARREEVVARVKEYTVEGARLAIKKADFIGNSRWTFIYEKTGIEVNIKDEAWLEWFRSSKASICAGAYIIADLTIITDVDDAGESIPGTEKYEIRKVKSKIILPDPEPEQQEIKID